MTRTRKDVAVGGGRSEIWQIERRGEVLMRMVGGTSTTTGIENAKDLEAPPPIRLEDAKTMMRHVEAQEVARTEIIDHREKALHRR